MIARYLIIVLFSCASIQISEKRNDLINLTEDIPLFPKFASKKIKAQVVSLKADNAIKHQHSLLDDYDIAYGLSQRLIESLYDSKSFELIETKQEMIDHIFNQYKLALSGVTEKDPDNIPDLKLKEADYLIYAEIVEFSVKTDESIIAFSSETFKQTLIGIQVKCVNVKTREMIPAIGYGEASNLKQAFILSSKSQFDKSTIGIASHRAINNAVIQLLKRL